MNTLERIKLWHGDHSPEYMERTFEKFTTCEIYDALQANLPMNELLEIVEDVDPDLLKAEAE